MISVEEAIRCVLDLCHPLPAEERSVLDASGRFLAEPLIARFDSPSFDASAVDGYALSGLDHTVPHRVVGCAEAGIPYRGPLRMGDCVRILTGAVVPPDAVAIAMQEDCRREGGRVFLSRPPRGGDHIRRQGEECRAGTVLLPPGSLVTPPVCGLATAQGYATLCVGGAPRIAILCTGSELHPPNSTLKLGEVYASNAAMLVTASRAWGLEEQAQLLPDDPDRLRTALESAFEESDLILTTGGVSVGDRDYVRQCARSIGVEEAFWRVAMKPGKPVFFGLRRGKPMLGLPGNPVAAAIAFSLFARPAILRLMGAWKPGSEIFPVRLAVPLQKRPGRTEFVRACLQIEPDGIVAHPAAGQGSPMIAGLAGAEALLHLPSERESFEKGEIVPASLMNWRLQ